MKKAINRLSVLLTAGIVCWYVMPAQAGEIWLSDIAWTSAATGWGTMYKDRTIDPVRNTFTLNGVVYTKGLGVHANSEIIYDLAGNYTTFTSDVGVDDEVGNNGTVLFEIYVDGTSAFNSGVMTYNSATQHPLINVAGKNQLRLVVTDGGDGINYDHGDWAGAKLVEKDPPPPPQSEIWLSDIAWTSAATGWGTMYKDRTIDPARNTFTLSGVTYAKGLGVNASSDITYDLNRQYKTFITDIGVDDEVGDSGSVEFYIVVIGDYGMDSLAYSSGVMTGSSPTQHVSVSVAGKYTMTLVVVDGGNGNSFDHADWAGAKLVKNDVTAVKAKDIYGRRNIADGRLLMRAGMPAGIFNLQGRHIGNASTLPGGAAGSGINISRFLGTGADAERRLNIKCKVISGR